MFSHFKAADDLANDMAGTYRTALFEDPESISSYADKDVILDLNW